ncbi:MAG: GNAT family N-acetyltransferase [Gallionellaceae bacterium]|jgi:putative hemolysin|nr:GNAT family N-acetyltransferase [Gallionellaceae bacterium]
MLQLRESPLHPRRGLALNLARTPADIEAAQHLRYKIFAEEMGARLPFAEERMDRDIFDAYCEHLLVRDNASDRVVGTYRLLSPQQAKNIGSYYSESEFDLVRLHALRERMVEVGRSCVHEDYRDGATIACLWSGIAEYMQRHGHEYLIGCASISMADGGHCAASIYRKLEKLHLSPSEYRVFPRCPLPLDALNNTLDAPVPPLIKGYMRLGAYVCGEPAWDPEFNTADLFILLPLSRLSARHARHFMKV